MIGVLGHKDARPGFFMPGRGVAPQNVSPYKAQPSTGADVRHAAVDQADKAHDLVPDPGKLSGKRRDDHADIDKQRPATDLTTADLDKDRPGSNQ